jgi:hypothetical protein
MKGIKFFLTPSVFIFFLMTMACKFSFDEQVVVPVQKPVLAIEAQFSLDEEPFVLVTRTRGIGEPIKWDFNFKDIIDKTPDTTIYNFKDYFDTVKNVTVQLYETDSLIRTFEQYSPYTKVGYVGKTVNYKKNVEYTLKIFAPGFDTVIGKQKPPSQVDLKKAVFTFNSANDKNGSQLSELAIDFEDIPNEDNYYAVDVYYEYLNYRQYKNLYPLKIIKIDNASASASYINDKTFDGQKHTWRVGLQLDEQYQSGYQRDSAELKIYFRSVSKDYTLYKRNAEINAAVEQSDFTEPTSTYTNLKGGIGVFTIFGRSSAYIIKLYK